MIQKAMSRTLSGFVAVGATLCLAVASAQAPGQQPDDPPAIACGCTAKSVECVFGTDDGCQISGCKFGCRCVTARCWLGFPSSATCECLFPEPG